MPMFPDNTLLRRYAHSTMTLIFSVVKDILCDINTVAVHEY